MVTVGGNDVDVACEDFVTNTGSSSVCVEIVTGLGNNAGSSVVGVEVVIDTGRDTCFIEGSVMCSTVVVAIDDGTSAVVLWMFGRRSKLTSWCMQ